MYTNISYNKKLIRFRILTYKIDNKQFFLGTTIMNHKINYFKNIYWKRWNIEIHFRESKYLCSLSNILSKNKNTVLQNIYSHNMLFIISNFFRYTLNKVLQDYVINFKNLNHLLVNHILYFIFYKNINSLEKLLKQILISLLKVP